MITLTRQGLKLILNADVIPAQGSSDVPVEFINDTETYQDYLIVPHIGWYDKHGKAKTEIAKYDDGIITLPASAFQCNGLIVISIGLVDNQDANHIEKTLPAIARVENAPEEYVELPEGTWENAVVLLVKQLNEQIQKDVQEAIKIANNASETANSASEKANEASKEAKDTIEDVNEAIGFMGQYEWQEPQIRFKQGDGTWGEWVDFSFITNGFQRKIKYGNTEPTVDQLEDGDVYFLLEDE